MLSLAIFLPLAGMTAILALPRTAHGAIRAVAIATTAAVLLILIGLWIGFDADGGYQFVQRVPWIETLGVGYAVGLDGLAMPLVLMTGFLFLAALVFSWPQSDRAKEYFAWFLLLETACLGVFSAMDLFLFYVFWDLTLVGMYFIIAIWGHAGARQAALLFFLYTFLGSLALLLGIIGLYLSAEPLTMDMAAIAAQQPFAEGGWLRHLVFFGLLIGLGVKVPVVPVHTWLPPAHAEAPAPGSAILAGVLLKMGTYGLLRILIEMMPGTAQDYAWLIIVIGVVSVIYGALVALAQTDLKRLIAYTSINHMGYIVMAIGAAALIGAGSVEGRALAINGAVLQMISHALITGALFLLAGVVWRRARTFELGDLGGLAPVMPAFAAAFGLAAFASLGLPGLSGFVAEFQIFVGTFDIVPVVAAVALIGILLTAGLFLWTLQRVLLGETPDRWRGLADLAVHEKAALLPMLAAVVAIGLAPWWVLAVIDGYGSALAAAIAR
jgi:NADH-quinone oxidoreductase subunit M